MKIRFNFEIEDPNFDPDPYFISLDFKGMANTGYMAVLRLTDPNLQIFDQLTRFGFFKRGRVNPLSFNFQILASEDGVYPESATKVQVATIVGFKSVVADGPTNQIEIVAVDPVTFALSRGYASGGVLVGSVDQVIKNIMPADIKLDIVKFKGNSQMNHYLMRQEPKAFILSLLDWASSLTESGSQILVGMDGTFLQIKDQQSIVSRQRGYYRRFGGDNDGSIDTIVEHQIVANNALSIYDGKLTTYSASGISGFYIDQANDPGEAYTVVDDDNTNKYVPKVDESRSFTKPLTGPGGAVSPTVGYTAIPAIPELFSGGEVGIEYQKYMYGRALSLYQGLSTSLIKMRMRVFGHGEFSDTIGLGADTIFVQMRRPAAEANESYMWVSGNWLVYGFHHRVSVGSWLTDLMCARLDHDAYGKRVGV